MVSKHEYCLGVDITVYQRAIYEEVWNGGYDGGLPPDVKIEAVGCDRRVQGPRRWYIARWARRNL